MTLALLRIWVRTGESHNVGHATSLADAAKKLTKMAKQEARAINPEAEVVQERDGYCIRLEPDRLAIYTFEEVPF
jgi:hypothetical protein